MDPYRDQLLAAAEKCKALAGPPETLSPLVEEMLSGLGALRDHLASGQPIDERFRVRRVPLGATPAADQDRPIVAPLMPDDLARYEALAAKLAAAHALTTGDRWFEGEQQDGEYTGPGDDPPGYAGDYYQDGSVWAAFTEPDTRADEEGRRIDLGVPEAVQVFEAGRRSTQHDARYACLARDERPHEAIAALAAHARWLEQEVAQLRRSLEEAENLIGP